MANRAKGSQRAPGEEDRGQAGVNDELEAAIEQLLHPTGPAGTTEPTVQLSVRMPASLRARIQQRAKAQDRSVQDFVVGQLVIAVGSGDADAELQEARRALREALLNGAYLDYLDNIDDPDLRND